MSGGHGVIVATRAGKDAGRARGMPARSFRAGCGSSPAARNRAGHGGLLTDAKLDHQHAVGLEQPGGLSRNGAIGVETIDAAIERAARVAPDLRGERGDVAAGDVGRVADDEVEAAGQRRAEIREHEFRARSEAEPARIVARGRQRLVADVGADAGGVRQLAEAAPAGSRRCRCRDRRCGTRRRAAPIKSSAVSTTVSVSGRGTSVASLRFNDSPQNSLKPTMRAIGSRASRRAASMSMSCAAPLLTGLPASMARST